MTDQEFTIDFLSTALVDVRMQLKELLVDLDLNEEVSEAIKTMQGGILIILDLDPLQGPDLRLPELPREEHRGSIDKKGVQESPRHCCRDDAVAGPRRLYSPN